MAHMSKRYMTVLVLPLTMVAAADTDIAGFLKAMQFSPAPLTALEKRL